ncbi:MAG TPA: hypothetical protein VM936_16385 [Pyrinomonadaceae bacterium]|jgi:hypothetical protein|nr:hypothetical protein [Pyrinomonadaceae bacterium]
MKLSCALLLCVLLSTFSPPQAKREIFERRAELEFGGGEKIVAHRLVGDGDRLLLLGGKTARALDLAAAEFTESHALAVPEYDEDGRRVISPDGRRVFVYGNYDSRRKEKAERPPSVWDLRTGGQVAVFDKRLAGS